MKKILKTSFFVFSFLALFYSNAFAFIEFKQSKVISSDTPGVRGINFKPDGTIMYVTGRRDVDGDTVIQYSLTTPFDISTATKTSETVLEILDADDADDKIDRPHAIEFKPDGKVMYVIHSLTGYKSVEQFDLTTAWDTSTLSYNARFSVSNDDVQLRGLTFKPDGTRMYIGQTTYGKVLQYDLATPWDVSSATNLVESSSYLSQENNIRNIQFTSDGTIMYLGGNGGNDINKYTLSTAWDVSTLNHITSYSVSAQTGTTNTIMTGLIFAANFTKLYVTADAGTVNTIFEYSVACAGIITCNPINDKDITATIEANVELSKRIIKNNTLPIFHRIEWLRRHKNKDNLSNLNAEINFTNEKISKLVTALKSSKKEIDRSYDSDDWFQWSEG